ncbi:MAG: hypothetical protein HOV77_06105 [Hamadaea sp.]|uniref:hypothetical protein n=1 Tax=Hamadaea sp. TaxID=2024425 RepID=UPI0017A40C7E|nr:hypothetical protein [Hamadaea sp.]NUT18739.1 hypothetical protein [Hamadaea sp.]
MNRIPADGSFRLPQRRRVRQTHAERQMPPLSEAQVEALELVYRWMVANWRSGECPV